MSAIALCYGRAATDTMLEGWLTSTCISCASRGLTPSPSPNPSPNPNPNPNAILTLTLTPTPALTRPLTRWFFVEPGFILLIVVLPCLCNNKYVDTCNDRLGDIGCDISLFLG